MKKKKTLFLFIFILMSCVSFAQYKIGEALPYDNSVAVFENNTDHYRLSNNKVDVQIFKDTQGYNKYYYQNGSVAIYDERIIIDYLKANGKWNQIGIPFKTDYEQIYDGYEIRRYYKDYAGTNFTVFHTLSRNSTLKITVELTEDNNISRDYRINWDLNGITNLNYEKGQHKYTFDDVEIDYTDVFETWGNITTDLVADVQNGKKINLYFRVGNQTDFVLDPSVKIDEATELYDEPTFKGINRNIIKTKNGTLYSFFTNYISGTKIDIIISKSIDFGETWINVRNLTENANDIRNIDGWITEDEEIYLVGFSKYGGGNIRTFKTTDFFSNVTNTTTITNSQGISIYYEPDGNTIMCESFEFSGDIINIYNFTYSTGSWTLKSQYDEDKTGIDLHNCDITKHNNDYYITAIKSNTSRNILSNGTLILLNSSDLVNWDNRTIVETNVMTGDSYSSNLKFNSKGHAFFLYTSYLGYERTGFVNSTNLIDFTINNNIQAEGNCGAYSTTSDENIMIDDNDKIHLMWKASGVENDKICYMNSPDGSKTWGGQSGALHGGGGENNLIAPSIANRDYPYFNNVSDVLRYVYFDNDANIVYYDNINLNIIKSTLTTPTFEGDNDDYKTDYDLTINSTYTHENRLNATVNVTWYRNGTKIYEDNIFVEKSGDIIEFTLDNGNYSKNDLINVSLVAEDSNKTLSDIVWSNTITILNSNPIMSSVNISPIPATGNMNLTCIYSFSDADSDTNTSQEYKWYKNDSLFGVTNKTLLSQNTSDGQTWKCSARVYDGTNYSDWYNSSSLLLGDTTAPNISNFVVPSSATQDAQQQIFADCVDNSGFISEVKVNLTDPDSIKTTLSLTNTINDTYRVLYTPTKTGNYLFDGWYCSDTSNNIVTNQTNYTMAVSSAPTPPAPGGGGSSGTTETEATPEFMIVGINSFNQDTRQLGIRPSDTKEYCLDTINTGTDTQSITITCEDVEFSGKEPCSWLKFYCSDSNGEGSNVICKEYGDDELEITLQPSEEIRGRFCMEITTPIDIVYNDKYVVNIRGISDSNGAEFIHSVTMQVFSASLFIENTFTNLFGTNVMDNMFVGIQAYIKEDIRTFPVPNILNPVVFLPFIMLFFIIKNYKKSIPNTWKIGIYILLFILVQWAINNPIYLFWINLVLALFNIFIWLINLQKK